MKTHVCLWVRIYCSFFSYRSYFSYFFVLAFILRQIFSFCLIKFSLGFSSFYTAFCFPFISLFIFPCPFLALRVSIFFFLWVKLCILWLPLLVLFFCRLISFLLCLFFYELFKCTPPHSLIFTNLKSLVSLHLHILSCSIGVCVLRNRRNLYICSLLVTL